MREPNEHQIPETYLQEQKTPGDNYEPEIIENFQIESAEEK